jgi:hypothetical protein
MGTIDSVSGEPPLVADKNVDGNTVISPNTSLVTKLLLENRKAPPASMDSN